MLLFHSFVALHILTGSIGAIAFWVPVSGRKGGVNHKRWGKVFNICLLITSGFAVGMSVLTLLDPFGTHPHLVGMFDADFIRGIFGWMMLHNGILTINLVWYGWLCITNRRDHAGNRTTLNLGLQGLLLAAAFACALNGWMIGQPLMIGIAIVGFATVATNLWFILNPNPGQMDWLKEHIKGLVGAGISVYTAFFAFGSVRIMPWLALHPALWSFPLVVGVGLIIWHRRKIDLGMRARRAATA
ncbi:MAG: hypothetical protein IOC63_05355 [Methylobacterium sp.]|nr:hypothetical protein [Methylobacterium sp.]MCA3615820.1 hypothetical protein [Methylobacterium sp.]MCA3641274.1 hypothetical protein [Methylobacterium sp.]